MALNIRNNISPDKIVHTEKLESKDAVANLARVEMPRNTFRHSFCAYHITLYGDAGKTATLLTHRGNVSILYEHYKGNTSRADGEQWFGIEP